MLPIKVLAAGKWSSATTESLSHVIQTAFNHQICQDGYLLLPLMIWAEVRMSIYQSCPSLCKCVIFYLFTAL